MLHSPYCPICKTPLRKVEGNQPLGGTMNHHVYGNPLPGYPKCGTITITYYIPSGTQGPEHPNPGKATDSHNAIRCMYSWLNVYNYGEKYTMYNNVFLQVVIIMELLVLLIFLIIQKEEKY